MDLHHPPRVVTRELIPFTKKGSNSFIWNLDITRKYDWECKPWMCWKKPQAVQDCSFLPGNPTDQNWEYLHFAGEIPASQRRFFHPILLLTTFPASELYCWAESIPGGTKFSLFHLPGKGDPPLLHPFQRVAVLGTEIHSSRRKHITVQITFEFQKFRIITEGAAAFVQAVYFMTQSKIM